MPSPLVSAVIPTYNRRDSVLAAVDSVLAQTWAPLEVIVVDDGSTDGTGERVRQRYANEPRVRYVWQDNAERAAARNRGIAEARGEFVAFLDSDDRWRPEKLARQMPLFDAPDVVLVHSGVALLDPAGEPIGDFVRPDEDGVTRGAVFDALAVMNRLSCLTLVARRAALERVGGFSTERYLLNFGEDWELWLRLAYAGRVGYVAEPLAVYRAHTPDGTEPPFDTARYERMLRQVGRALGAAARRRLRAAAAERYRLLAAEARAAGNGAAALRLRLRALRFRALG